MLESVNCPIAPRYYQWRAAIKSCYHKRMIVEHCTGAGKSLTIAIIINYLLYKNPNFKILVLVPRLDLVEQMVEGNAEYGIKKELIGKYNGTFKQADKQIVVSTWQSMHPETYLLSTFNVLIVDECHLQGKAKVVRSVAENSINAEYRIGLTGSLPDSRAENLLIKGVLGFIGDIVKVSELAQQKMIATPKIHIPFLKYNDKEVKNLRANQKLLPGIDAQRLEQKFLSEHPERNHLIYKICKKFISRNQNILVLVTTLDHCEIIKQKLLSEGITPLVVTGEIKDIEERTRIRKLLDSEGGNVLIATSGVYSTGISINRLHAIIFAASSKSKIRTLQSVGRGLRMDPRNDKTELYLYDLVDDLKYSNDAYQERIV
jgi:superfamily II DNA or RNA helicase